MLQHLNSRNYSFIKLQGDPLGKHSLGLTGQEDGESNTTPNTGSLGGKEPSESNRTIIHAVQKEKNTGCPNGQEQRVLFKTKYHI